MSDAPMSATPITAAHPDGGPAAETYQQHVPFVFRYTRLTLGSPPEQVTETRNLLFTHFSYRKLAEALGVDLREMSKQTRLMRRRYAELTRKHGKKKADKMFSDEFSDAANAGGVFGSAADVELDDIEQVAAMVWAGLITEDPTITQQDVLKMITAQNQTDVMISAVKSINIYLHGEQAANIDYQKVKDEIEAGIRGDASQEAVHDALGIETEEDAAEADSVRQARATGATADDDDDAADDGDEGNAPAA